MQQLIHEAKLIELQTIARRLGFVLDEAHISLEEREFKMRNLHAGEADETT